MVIFIVFVYVQTITDGILLEKGKGKMRLRANITNYILDFYYILFWGFCVLCFTTRIIAFIGYA